MILINDARYVDMSHLATEETLAELDREIMLGLAKSTTNFLTIGKELTFGIAEMELYDHRFKDVGIAERELADWEIEELKGMNFQQRQQYLKFAKGAYFPWAICNSLLTGSAWNDKMKPEGKVVTDEAKRLFPKLLEWCYALPIFESIGRICIFGIDASQHVTCHRDADPAKWLTDDELLMVSPRGNKKFYLYDPETKAKFEPPSKIFIFHDQNYHGVEPTPYFTYNFRIMESTPRSFEKLCVFSAS